jgi:hypothetical protein
MLKSTIILMAAICVLSLTPAFALNAITSAVGSSTLADEGKAVAEVLSEVNAEVPNFAQNADICLLFSNVYYDEPEMLVGALRENGVNIPVWGATSSHAIMTTDGYEISENGGVSMLFLSGKTPQDLKVGVAAADIGTTRPNAVSSGKEAIEEAIAMLGDSPQIILVSSAPGMEEAIIEGIESVVGKRIPIVGGGSADNTVEGYWKQFANDQVYEHAVVIAAISTSVKIGYDFAHGYTPTEKTAYVKASSEYGRLVEKLDDTRALDLYADWINKEPRELEGMNLLGASLFSPVAIHNSIGGRDYYVPGHPAIGDSDNGTMFCFKEFSAATKITLMEATAEDLVLCVGDSIEEALEKGRIKDKHIAALFLVHCAGRRSAIGDEQMEDVVTEIKESIGCETPFITLFPFGEQGNNHITGNRHGNLCIAPLIFSNRP